jgi:hypothetical protein
VPRWVASAHAQISETARPTARRANQAPVIENHGHFQPFVVPGQEGVDIGLFVDFQRMRSRPFSRLAKSANSLPPRMTKCTISGIWSRFFLKIKNYRGIAIRYFKTDTSFAAFVSIAATMLWLK